MHALFVAFHKRNLRILEKAEKGKSTRIGFESKIGSLEQREEGMELVVFVEETTLEMEP